MDANKRIEKTVVSGYKRIEDTVVSGYKKIEDKFVEAFLTDDEGRSGPESGADKEEESKEQK
jgi:hypothetical protein